MAVGYNPRAVTDGLVLALDAGNPKNYNVGISTNWTDKVGGNNGTLVGGTYHTDGPFVGAGYVEFDGNSDSLTVPASTDFTLDGEFTAEFWIYLNTIVLDSQHPSPITFSQSGGNKGQIYVNASNNYFGLWNGSSNVVTTGNNSVTTGTWYHVAVTRDASNNCRIFLDGVLKDTASSTVTFGNASGDLRIGSFNGTGGDVNGNISNLRVIKGTALYTSNFTPKRQPLIPESAPNTVLLTCQKGTIRDRSPSAHAITINGNAKSISGASYFEFDGTNDYIDLGDTFDDIIAGADKKFSMEIWINPDTVSGTQHLISKNGDSNFSENNREFYMVLSNGEVKSGASFNPSTAQSREYTTSSANLTAGSWHHIVLVYDGSIDAAGRFTFYVNGQNEAATETYTNGSWGDIQDTAARFAIGAMVGANVANSPLNPYNGKVSNAKVYSRLLTAAEVKQNYRNTKGRYGL